MGLILAHLANDQSYALPILSSQTISINLSLSPFVSTLVALLDLIFADCRDSIHDISVDDPFSISDHHSIKFGLLFHKASSQKSQCARLHKNVNLKFNFAVVDWQTFNAAFSS